MGPRSGSPATETRASVGSVPRRCAPTRAGAAVLLILALGLSADVWADSAQTSHDVSVVVVKSALSITDDTGNFSLTFDRAVAGASSSTQTVNYRVMGNGFPTGALPGVISAVVANPANGIELKADVGPFVNNGTEGDIVLQEAASGDQGVGVTSVPLANKGSTAGTQARVLNGTIPVTWKANATQDLSSGEYPLTVTVTLKDA